MIMVLSILVPTNNGRNLLEKSINPLLYSLQVINPHEIIVIDNNSNDGTEIFIHKFNNIRYIKLDKNYGFTGAVNQGAKQAKGEYLLILNNDCYLENDTVKKMIDFLEKNKKYIATQPVVHKSKTEEIENIGYMVDLWKGKAEPIVDWNFQFPISNFQKIENLFRERYLYGLAATCLLIRRDIFMKIGMFDVQFHSYLEDVDLFFRLKKAGYLYSPTLTAKCYHAHMATSSKMGCYKEKQDVKNWIRIIGKNYPLKFTLLHFPTLFLERLKNLSGLIKKVAKIYYGSHITSKSK